MKTVFVTGATGFTGGHLARKLAKDGYKVKALVRPGKNVEALKALGIEIIPGDLTDAKSLSGALSGVDIVYHVAAVYREEGIDHKVFWNVNVGGTENLLKEAKSAKVKRFVHCSTVGVQGEIKNPPAKEEDPFNPGDYYQQSKLDGELLALDFFKKEGLPGVVFRPVGIYGPGDTRFLKFFKMIQSGKFPMFGSGNVLYHLTYIDDLVEGIKLVGEVPNIEGEVFTLAGERYTTLNEWVEILEDVLGSKVPKLHLPVWPLWTAGAICEFLCQPFKISPPIYRRRVDFFIKDRAFDITKAKNKLGYSPKIDLKEGLSKTADWYYEQGMLLKSAEK